VTRKYELKKRAERQAETRQRIVEAAVALHSTLGPAQTSFSAIAKKAGVQRHTLYAHFPDEPSLFRACSSHWLAVHPMPDPSRWASSADPRLRLRRALEDLYGWYDGVGDQLELFQRDALISPNVAAVQDAWADELRQTADALAAPLGRRRAVRAAVGHALAFETWRSLVRHEGLTSREAVRAMLSFVESV